jgi:transposase
LSLPDFSSQSELFGLHLRRDDLFSATDRYRIFAERVYPVLVKARERLAACYCQDNGRPATEPVVVLGVSVLQFMERLPDRQALEHLQYHVGWKYALGQELGKAVFDPTVLVRFRQRLLKHDQERLIFEEVLNALEAAGLVSKRAGAQRLDSTHVLGLVKRMSVLDNVREALRLVLKALAEEHFKRRPVFWEILWERYVESSVDYRAAAEVVAKKLVQAGQDVQMLLAWLTERRFEAGPKSGPRLKVLQALFAENFQAGDEASVTPIPPAPGECRIQNVHDLDATYRAKGGKKWVGYGVQVAETVPEEGTGFITSMAAQTALGSDPAGMDQTLQEQQAMGFEKPRTLYVDTAYVSAEALEQAAREQRELAGPARGAHRAKQGYSSELFRADLAQRQAWCPAGELNTQCSRIGDRHHGKAEYRFEWSWKCRGCKLRDACLSSTQVHRTIRVRDNFMYLQARRDEMKTDAFKAKMRRRAGIEATISELVRGYGLRHARYRGLAKMRLQSYFSGAACNINRWIRRLAEPSGDLAKRMRVILNPLPGTPSVFCPA